MYYIFIYLFISEIFEKKKKNREFQESGLVGLMRLHTCMDTFQGWINIY